MNLQLLLLAFVLFLFPNTIDSIATATSNVTFTIASINALSVSGNPGTLSVTTATAGSQPNAVSDMSTTYNLTTNATAQRITGALNVAMPANTTLQVLLIAPGGASSAGAVSLSTTPQNLVTGISTLAQSGLGITYTFSATVAVTPFASSSCIVTYTLGP